MSYAARKRPLPGSATARVWEIADELLRQRGSLPSGREVVDRYVAEGGNEGTGFTQYSHWKKAQEPRPAVAHAGASRWALLHIDPDGRLTLPREFLAEMKLDPTGKVTALLRDGEVRLISPRVGLREAQAWVKRFDTGEGSPVDELIRERRAEAERE
jgi:hypothetical protein